MAAAAGAAGQGGSGAARRAARPGRAGAAVLGRLAWLHVASLGEAASILALIERLAAAAPDLAILVTSGTLSSARLLAERLPPCARHQFAPLDRRAWVAAFLDHWRPDLAVWVESELWPNLIAGTARRGVPMALLNARLSARSERRWGYAPAALRRLLAPFALILAGDPGSAARLARLAGRPVGCAGTLKAAAAPLPADAAELARLRQAIGGRPAWLAASTHEGEERLAAAVDARLRPAHPELLTIIVPRHAERGEAIAAALAADGTACVRRSRGDCPGPGTRIYLADTMGELGLFYRLAPVAFLGKSLAVPGGHNPLEPARLGCAVVSGRRVENFAALYEALAAAGGVTLVEDEAGLAQAVGRLLADEALRRRQAEAAAAVAAAGDAVAERVAARLLALMERRDAAA
ncbi:MAG: glycosyltransferase N-terminal domain-containing protein [Dongiaceae bacterium]